MSLTNWDFCQRSLLKVKLFLLLWLGRGDPAPNSAHLQQSLEHRFTGTKKEIQWKLQSGLCPTSLLLTVTEQ